MSTLAERPAGGTAEEIAAAVGVTDDIETVFHVLEHLAASPGRGVRRDGADPFTATYRAG